MYKNTYNPDCTSNKLHSEKYGFIEIENPEYYKKDNGCWAVPEFLLRKPTPKERKEIIVNYIIAHNENGMGGIYGRSGGRSAV